MDNRLHEFTELIRVVEAQASFLSASRLFVIGTCSAKTSDYPVTYIIDLVRRLGELAECGIITEAKRLVSEFLLSEGEVKKVMSIVEKNSANGRKRKREPKEVHSLEHFTQRIIINGQIFLKNPKTEEITLMVDPTQEIEETGQRVKSREVDESVPCAVCLENIPEQDFLPLEKCGCFFHQACVLTYLVAAIEDRNFPITCPQANCKSEIHPLDLKERLSKDQFSKYEQNQFEWFLTHNVKSFQHCLTPDCKFVFSWTKENPRFKCPLCAKVYCLLCNREYHDGATCQEYKQLTDPQQLDQQFQVTVRQAAYNTCPECGAWVEKVDGCDHVTCICGTDFCYSCGQLMDTCECE